MDALPGACATLPSTLLAHAARTPHRSFVEVWSPARGVARRVSYGELAECMLAAGLWLRDGIGMAPGAPSNSTGC